MSAALPIYQVSTEKLLALCRIAGHISHLAILDSLVLEGKSYTPNEFNTWFNSTLFSIKGDLKLPNNKISCLPAIWCRHLSVRKSIERLTPGTRIEGTLKVTRTLDTELRDISIGEIYKTSSLPSTGVVTLQAVPWIHPTTSFLGKTTSEWSSILSIEGFLKMICGNQQVPITKQLPKQLTDTWVGTFPNLQEYRNFCRDSIKLKAQLPIKLTVPMVAELELS